MSNHDPIRAALIKLRDAVEGIELEGVPEVDEALAAVRVALATPPAEDGPAVPQEGRGPGAAKEEDRSQFSDGFHTFAELYEHRHSLMLALMRALPSLCWFSERHSNGELPFGSADWFIVGADLPTGAITYHLPIALLGLAAKTGAAKLEKGRVWDGHVADDVIQRLRVWACRSTPAPVEGEVGELVAFLMPSREQAGLIGFEAFIKLRRAAALLQAQNAELATLRAGVQVAAIIVRFEFEVLDELDQTVASGDASTLEEAVCEGRHYLSQYQQDGPCKLELRRVEVLSPDVIPQPPQGGEVEG